MPDSVQAAFVLHRRNYRDSSQIIELFTHQSGRISVVAKGAKRNKSPLRTSLHMFQPLLVNWQGKHELMTLTHAELQESYSQINGKFLAWAFYVNELLFRLLHKHEPYPYLYQKYQDLIQLITQQIATEADLRIFECELLERMGYGLHLDQDHNDKALQSDQFYFFEANQIPVVTTFHEGKHVYLGEHLIALQQKKLTTAAQLKAAKRLLRNALQQLLGDKPLKSRELLL